jgi:hypothetical protein
VGVTVLEGVIVTVREGVAVCVIVLVFATNVHVLVIVLVGELV